MARYLTAEWFEAVSAAVERRPVGGGDGGGRLTLQQVVTGGPDGEVRYWVRLDGDRLEVGLGEADAADATISQSYETAVAVVTGKTEVQTALLAGDIRLSGNMRALLDNQPALRGLDTVLSDVRRRTSFS